MNNQLLNPSAIFSHRPVGVMSQLPDSGGVALFPMAYIYSLNCPITGEPKYIGQTRQSLSTRLYKHLNDKRHGSKRMSWIVSLLKQNLKPTIELLDTVSLEEIDFWETYYIFLYRTWGFNLKNTTFGGDGRGITISPISEVTRQKMSEAKLGNTFRRGAVLSTESKEKMSIARTGYKPSSESVRKMAETRKRQLASGEVINGMTGRKLSEEHKAALLRAITGRKNTLASRKKMSESAKARRRRERNLLNFNFK